MEFIVIVLQSLAKHRVLFVFLATYFFMAGVFLNYTKFKLRGMRALGAGLLIYSLVNFIWGPGITAALVHQYGEKGVGIVTQIRESGSVYNDKPVMIYDVMLKTQEGKTMEAAFESTDFNVYPQPEEGSYDYPPVGIQFSVRYLKRKPSAFVIVGDDHSPYAMDARCKKMEARMQELKIKSKLDPSHLQYQSALREYLALNCQPSNSK